MPSQPKTKEIKVHIPLYLWEELHPLLTHHGHLSFIVRQAIQKFVLEWKKEGREKNDNRVDKQVKGDGDKVGKR